MLRAYVLVHDKRTCTGDRIKFKCFETLEECMKWASKIKNSVDNTVRVYDLDSDDWSDYRIERND